MLISLDYDDTFTADPFFWREFVKLAEKYNHKVVCITARPLNVNNHITLKRSLPDIPIVFCGLKAKKKVAISQGYEVDVWIDDTPEAITGGY